VKHGQHFTDLMQVHVLQLPKFVHAADELENDLEAWLYLFRYPQSIDPDHLPARLNQPIYRRAIQELEMLTQDDQERMRYEARMLAIRTHQTLLEEAEERGIEKGEHIGRIHQCSLPTTSATAPTNWKLN
jgi:predicted transposase/invertase (TIGR01784 family)